LYLFLSAFLSTPENNIKLISKEKAHFFSPARDSSHPT
jgi:hypothetical protein